MFTKLLLYFSVFQNLTLLLFVTRLRSGDVRKFICLLILQSIRFVFNVLDLLLILEFLRKNLRFLSIQF